MRNILFPVPISFHIFNRPETTRRVFQEIKAIRPSQLFITADGPREGVKGDDERCREVRSIVDKIDWECEVFKNFSEVNKGSYRSTSEGITWVFQSVDRAIILEDDCIPHPSFFRFCSELLDYYKYDLRVALITGNCWLENQLSFQYSYYFSRYTNMWGWATWKNRWQQIDCSMSNWPEFRAMDGLKSVFRKKYELDYWNELMQDLYEGKKGPHWDYLLMLTMFMNNSLAIKPAVNLIKNVGYGSDSTHFLNKNKKVQDNPLENLKFPLKHPPCIHNYMSIDEYTHAMVLGGYPVYIKKRIKRKLPSFLIYIYKKLRGLFN